MNKETEKYRKEIEKLKDTPYSKTFKFKTSKLKTIESFIKTIEPLTGIGIVVIIIGCCYIIPLLLKCAAFDPENANLYRAFIMILVLWPLILIISEIESYISEKRDTKEKIEKDNIYSHLEDEEDLFTHKKNLDWEEDLFTHKEDSIDSDLTVHSTRSYYY
ncbi:hypothetical protein, partial [Thermodesulfovibrio yellowstonii]|uniref:hypothetical protein n=1 Tax=Thermodesulfovibrio yellowstonii TaxID=28262 RepID=UPI003C7E8634